MIHKILKLSFILNVLLFTISAAQNLEENKAGKNDFVEQLSRELEKAKKFKIQTRYRYAGFYETDGVTPQEKILVEKLSFDKNGNRKQLIRYQGNGEVDQTFSFSHDAKGRLIKMETRNSYDYVVGKRESKYDKNGYEVERKLFDVRRGDHRVVFKNDKNGNIIESKNFDKSKKLAGRYENTFENGFPKKTTVYNKDGKVRREVWFIYNQEGKLIREDIKDLQGAYSVYYSYDSNGNIKEILTPQNKRVITYNENNEIIEDLMFNPEGVRQYRVAFSYLENTLQNDEIRYDNDDKPAFQANVKYEFYK